MERALQAALACWGVDERYLIGVSGGRDSVALLHAMAAMGYRRLVVCHLDHALRGRQSSGDARFVRALAARLGFPFLMERVDVAALASAEKLSIETAARNARYDFFARVARRRRCFTLFLAHHADDQVETFLFNLFRGAGAEGLSGMRPVSERALVRGTLKVVRPMLNIWRSEIDEWAREKRIAHREDTSNAERGPSRNRVRNEIIPFIEAVLRRDIRHPIWRSAEILSSESDMLGGMAPALDEEASAARLRALALPLQRRALQTWLAERGVANVGFQEVEAVRSLLMREAPAKVNLPNGRHARRRAGKLFIE